MSKIEHKQYFYPSGKIKYEAWYKEGKYHREVLPAYIKYYESGKIEYEAWYKEGNTHREVLPAIIEYEESEVKDETNN